MIKLLLIEDDINLGYIIKSSLEQIVGGYEVALANNGEEGLKIWEIFQPEVIISDIDMPVLNGLEVVKRIRQTDTDTPIILATAKSSSKDVISGYALGVNNYIKKPFLPEELDAHVKALINLKQNTTKVTSPIYKFGIYKFDPKHYSLEYDSKKQMLTARESQILELLCKNKGEVVQRDDILLKFWGLNDYFTSRSLDVFISKMRRYLSHDPSISIKNIKGVGLILEYE